MLVDSHIMSQGWLGAFNFEVLAFTPPGWGAVLLDGLLKSLVIAGGAYTLALVIGTIGACGKLYGGQMVRDVLWVYTTLVRAIPELVLILLLYYAGTDGLNRILAYFGYGAIDISGLAAGILVLGIVIGAYMTEVIRGAIQAIAPGQVEAGRAYGMRPFKLFRRI